MKFLQIPLEDFFKNPEKTNFKIAPDGKNLAFLSSYKRRLNIFVQQLGKTATTRLTAETDRDIAAYMWANNNTLLFLKDEGGNENYKLFGVNITNMQQQCFTPFADVTTQIIDELEDIDDALLIGLNKRNPQIFDVYKLTVSTGNLELVFENPGNVSSYITDHKGVIRLLITTDGVSQSFLYRNTEADEFKPVLQTNFKESIAPLFFDFNNEMLYASSNINRDKSAIVKVDPQNFNELDLLFEHNEVDVESLSYSRKQQKITSCTYTAAKKQYHFFDEKTKKLFHNIQDQIGEEYEFGISSYDKDEEHFIVRSYSDKSLGKYFLYERSSNSLFELADVSPWINEEQMAEMRPISYPSRDGLTINGYLTIPRGRKAKDLPVIVNPHGGPWWRDFWGFSNEVQFLANRGYAVFQMNFRGSTGYGRQFWESSFKQWGQNMQNDITDGVNWLIEQGIAKPDKIAIYGGSYGGYATLAGVCFTPELYKCAVDYVGVSNLFTFMETIPPYWQPYLKMMYEMVGHPEEDREMLEKYSPVFHAEKIQCPLMIVQGANDPRVKKAESDQMVEALKAKGIAVEYMVKYDEGHGFRNEENKFEFYRKMEAFLNEHLNNG